MSQLSKGWDPFWACMGSAGDDVLDQLGMWRLNINDAYVTSPFVDDITNKLNNLEQLVCMNETVNQELLNYQTGLTGLLAPIEACLAQFYALEGALLLQEIVDYIVEIGDYSTSLTALIAGLNAQITDLENQRDRLLGRASLAFLIWQQDNPAYYAKYATDKDEYSEGELIEFDIETTLKTTEIKAWVVDIGVFPPTIEEVPESSIQPGNGSKMQVLVQVPSTSNRFSVKFQLLAQRGDADLYFADFDVQSTTKPDGGKKRYVRRPCPPV